MKIDTNLGFDYWIDILASVVDNPSDSIHTEDELASAIAVGFNEDILAVKGAVQYHFLFDEKEAKWEIVS